MSLRGLLALAMLALLLASNGCRTAADHDGPGAPGGDVPGTETRSDDRPVHPSSKLGTPGTPALAKTLVSVATTPASDAQPCERMCGSLGDCLFDDDDYNAVAASGLELECLDMCVHSPDDHQAKTKFLACGEQDGCGNIKTCVAQRWDALAEIRESPEIQGIVASSDPCKLGCRWLYACMFTGLPPGEAYLDPQLENQMNMCIDDCDRGRNDPEALAKLASCLPNNCSYERAYSCWENY